MEYDNVKYIIHGRSYIFEDVKIDGGVLFGYCKKAKKWGWLYPNYIHFKDGSVQLGARISCPLLC